MYPLLMLCALGGFGIYCLDFLWIEPHADSSSQKNMFLTVGIGSVILLVSWTISDRVFSRLSESRRRARRRELCLLLFMGILMTAAMLWMVAAIFLARGQ